MGVFLDLGIFGVIFDFFTGNEIGQYIGFAIIAIIVIFIGYKLLKYGITF